MLIITEGSSGAAEFMAIFVSPEVKESETAKIVFDNVSVKTQHCPPLSGVSWHTQTDRSEIQVSNCLCSWHTQTDRSEPPGN